MAFVDCKDSETAYALNYQERCCLAFNSKVQLNLPLKLKEGLFLNFANALSFIFIFNCFIAVYK